MFRSATGALAKESQQEEQDNEVRKEGFWVEIEAPVCPRCFRVIVNKLCLIILANVRSVGVWFAATAIHPRLRLVQCPTIDILLSPIQSNIPLNC